MFAMDCIVRFTTSAPSSPRLPPVPGILVDRRVVHLGAPSSRRAHKLCLYPLPPPQLNSPPNHCAHPVYTHLSIHIYLHRKTKEHYPPLPPNDTHTYLLAYSPGNISMSMSMTIPTTSTPTSMSLDYYIFTQAYTHTHTHVQTIYIFTHIDTKTPATAVGKQVTGYTTRRESPSSGIKSHHPLPLVFAFPHAHTIHMHANRHTHTHTQTYERVQSTQGHISKRSCFSFLLLPFAFSLFFLRSFFCSLVRSFVRSHSRTRPPTVTLILFSRPPLLP